jgi:hypothetical protein
MHGHPYKPLPKPTPKPRAAMRLVWVLICCAAAYVIVIDDRADANDPFACSAQAADANR